MSLRKFRATLPAALVIITLVLGAMLTAPAPKAAAASLTEITGFGTNPTNLRMHLYVPDAVAAKPAVLVAAHYCTGSGEAFYSGTEFARMADRYGFIVIYPTATRSSKCFDVSTSQALTHDGGSDPTGIVSMVRYVLQRHNGDAARVYVTGVSSGAMLTNVLLGSYPDVFKAGAAFAGVPFGCFATTDSSGWNSTCAQGNLIKTAQQWGDLVRAAYPGYTGPRPRMQLWHGTGDDTLRYPNFTEAIKQWTNVAGISQTPTTTDSPQQSWTRTRYNSGSTVQVEAISIQGGSHNIMANGMAQHVMDFFGLSGDEPPPDPPGDGTCRITYTTSAWNTGLTANITIANTGTSTISGWTLAFTLPSGQTITSGWSATYTPTSGAVTAKNVNYNPTITPGTSTGIGFQASHTGNAGKPTAYTLNGATCAIA
ncbi:MAG: PHB depolymerase family esterase [Kibdelosporangium sp.]